MGRVSVGAAFFQAVMNGMKTGVMTVFAGMKTFVMLRILVFVDVGHGRRGVVVAVGGVDGSRFEKVILGTWILLGHLLHRCSCIAGGVP